MNYKHYNGIIAKWALLLALLTATAPAAQAQDYRKEVEKYETSYSIVREYRQDVRIVYSHDGGKNGGEFLMVTESGVTTQLMAIIDDATVYDFEIRGDTVFFCGLYSALSSPMGFFGHFSLSGFPTSTVFGCFVPEFFYFGKMEVYVSRYGGGRRIVMTASTLEGRSYLVEFPFPNGSPVTMYYMPTATPVERFEDVAVSGNYVVATSVQRNGNKRGYLYYFNQPASNSNLFSGVVDTLCVNSHITSNMLLESCSRDYYAVAYQTTTANNSVTNVGEFMAWSNTVNNIAISPRNDDQFPVDIKYDKDDNDLDVLCNEITTTDTSSIIYHIDGNYVVTGRRYDDQRISSIDYLETDPGYFFGSGTGSTGYLWLYRYSPLVSQSYCSRVEEPIYEKKILQLNMAPITPSIETLYAHYSHVIRQNDSANIIIKCYDNEKEEENTDNAINQ